MIPPEWIIYNAPRPLYGSPGREYLGATRLCWQGDFVAGVFYAAVDPQDLDAALWRQRNYEQDARRLEWVTIGQMREAVLEYLVTSGYDSVENCQIAVEQSTDGEVIATYRAGGMGLGEEPLDA